jgi:hypothetical protein
MLSRDRRDEVYLNLRPIPPHAEIFDGLERDIGLPKRIQFYKHIRS